MAKSPHLHPMGGLFIGRRRWLFVFIPLVGSNITKRSLEFTNRSLEFTNRSLNAVNKTLDLTNKPLNHYFGPLLYTKVCLPLVNLSRNPNSFHNPMTNTTANKTNTLFRAKLMRMFNALQLIVYRRPSERTVLEGIMLQSYF
jgi:hypothetical protein